MFKTFRLIALLEGISYLLLMGAAIYKRMPDGDDVYVKLLGMPHGLLFVAYIVLAIIVSSQLKWPKKTLSIVLLASIIPFGTFYIDREYLK
jgi:integral membrane protein